jgi:hypothetical protein
MPDRTIVTMRFDHGTGTASRVVVDEVSGRILQEQVYPGRPQSSDQEFREAVSIVRRDARLARFFAEGAIAEGGFVVDGPPGHPAKNRYVQIRLLTPDRRHLVRVALVDLTRRIIASVRSSFE